MRRTSFVGCAIAMLLSLGGCEGLVGGTGDSLDIEATQEAMLPSPAVAAITPNVGPTSGGTIVVIDGASFGRGVSVFFGDARGEVERVSSAQLRVTSPAHLAGRVAIRVANGNGHATTVPDGFTYSDAPVSDAGAPDGGDAETSSPTTTCSLQPSGPVTATADGQIIEGLRITANSAAGISVDGKSNVTIRNCEIHHANGAGVDFVNATGLHIQNVVIVNDGAPASGAASTDGEINISGASSSGVVIDHVKLTGGSSGIYLLSTPAPQIRFVEGHDFRGPFPRGQLVQFDKSDNGVLEDFSAENPAATSWPEDNISVYQSSGTVIRRGLLAGNNSPSGVGVMVESTNGVGGNVTVEDVDTVDQGNGSFSAYPSTDVTFRRVRARDNHCGDQQGRGVPLSNGLVFAASTDSNNIKVEQGVYFNLCNPSNVAYDQSRFTTLDITQQDFTSRPPQRLTFCWNP